MCFSLHFNYVFEKSENKFDCYYSYKSDAGLAWVQPHCPYQYFPPQCVKHNLFDLIWLDFWKEKDLKMLNYSFMIQCGVILKLDTVIQADPGMWAEHQFQLGCLRSEFGPRVTTIGGT